jgi:Putative adhesin
MKLRLFLCIVALAFFGATAVLASNQSVNISEHGAHSCADVHISYDGDPAVMAEESLTVPGNVPLNITPGQNGGVTLTGYDGSQFQVTVCKAARTQAELANMRAQLTGDQLTATGSEQGSSLVYFIVNAPRSASVSVKTHNGPVDVSGLSGNVQVHTQNGPIKIRKTSGEVQAYAQNGPISFAGDSGRIQLHASNGPVQLSLAGTHWNSGSVDASTENGPVSPYVSPDYPSGVVVRTDGHSPMSCEADLCRDARQFSEPGRSIVFGSGDPIIKVETHNGPVNIAGARDVL